VNTRTRATIELVLAGVAAIGTVACWLAAASTVVVAPILPTEPAKTSVVYSPTLIALAFLLAILAGVLAVVGVVRLRR
jgi:hypothetical protein